MPPDLVKGYQPPPEQQRRRTMRRPTPAPKRAATPAAAKPKPKPKPKPAIARAPSSSPAAASLAHDPAWDRAPHAVRGDKPRSRLGRLTAISAGANQLAGSGNRRRNPRSLPGRLPPLRRAKANRRRSRRNRTGRIRRRPAPIHAEPVQDKEPHAAPAVPRARSALAVRSRHVLHHRHCRSAQRRQIDAVQPPCRGAARPRRRSAGRHARPPGRRGAARRSIVSSHRYRRP